MSVYFIALFDLKASGFSVESFLEQLTTSPDVARVAELYPRAEKDKLWEINVSPGGEPYIDGPGGLSFRFRRETVQMCYRMRFSMFTGEVETRQCLRRASRAIAHFLSSPRVIYTHELMPCQGNNLDQIDAGLRVKIGPPAVSFDELHEAEDFGPGAWYIDTFGDLTG